MMNPKCPPNVLLGKEVCIDDNVLLGCLPKRPLQDPRTLIGDRAVIRWGTVIYAGVAIGSDFETGHHVIVREENVIGNGVKIWGHSTIDYGCKIGDRVKIHNQVYVCQGTVIEEGVFLAPGVRLANDRYPGHGSVWECPVIKRGAQIGMNVTLLPGVVIGEGALIGSGSVVTKDIPPYVIAYGSPARVLGKVDPKKLQREPKNPYHPLTAR